MRLVVRDPSTRETTGETIDVDTANASRTASDLARNRFVTDEVFFDGQGREQRRWISTRNDPLDIEACARVNPVSAAMFNLCHRVLTERQESDRTRPRDRWDWLRKSDGALVEVETSDRVR